MNKHKISKDFQVIEVLIKDYLEQGDITAIERELLLEKLRCLYESLRFEIEVPREKSENEISSHVGETSTCKDEIPQNDIEVESITSPPAMDSGMDPAPTVSEVKKEITDSEHDCGYEYEMPKKDPKKVRQALMSLYEDGETPPTESHVDMGSTPSSGPYFHEQSATTCHNSEKAVPQESPVTPVVNDVLAAEPTVADLYAAEAVVENVADSIGTGKIDSLIKSIGINDKFLMIRDLFAGSQHDFEDTISTLDRFTELEDAMLYIYENYNWNPDSEGVKLLIDLLTRKLS